MAETILIQRVRPRNTCKERLSLLSKIFYNIVKSLNKYSKTCSIEHVEEKILKHLNVSVLSKNHLRFSWCKNLDLTFA